MDDITEHLNSTRITDIYPDEVCYSCGIKRCEHQNMKHNFTPIKITYKIDRFYKCPICLQKIVHIININRLICRNNHHLFQIDENNVFLVPKLVFMDDEKIQNYINIKITEMIPNYHISWT